MKAKLAGIAAHCGMEKVYHLQGADLYHVESVDMVPGRKTLQAPAPRCDIRAGTRAVIDRLNTELNAALTDPEIRAKLETSGIAPTPGTPETFAATLRKELGLYGPVIKAAGIKLN